MSTGQRWITDGVETTEEMDSPKFGRAKVLKHNPLKGTVQTAGASDGEPSQVGRRCSRVFGALTYWIHEAKLAIRRVAMFCLTICVESEAFDLPVGKFPCSMISAL